MATTPDPRISGRIGSQIDLNVTYYKSGIPTDPFAIRRISIYKSAVATENLIVQIPIVSVCDPNYPAPITREIDSGGNIKNGVFHMIWNVSCTDIQVPDIFFDVWEYMTVCPENAGSTGGSFSCSNSDIEQILDDETRWQRVCNEFWLYPDSIFADSGLENIRLGFEPLDIKFYQPEVRTLEIGIMPLPLYDFNYNKIAPIIPHLRGTISVYTENCELIIDHEPMKIGLRQGTYRSNPFVLQYALNTTRFLKGTYRYRVELLLPNGESRASPDFYLQVS